MHLDWGEDAWVLLSSVTYTISILQHYRSTMTGPLCGIADWSVCYVVVTAVDNGMVCHVIRTPAAAVAGNWTVQARLAAWTRRGRQTSSTAAPASGQLPVLDCPAHVVQWSNHLGAMCSRAWHLQWLGFGSIRGSSWARPPTKKELF